MCAQALADLDDRAGTVYAQGPVITGALPEDRRGVQSQRLDSRNSVPVNMVRIDSAESVVVGLA